MSGWEAYSPLAIRPVAWNEGDWTTPPAAVEHDGDALVVTAVESSDAWRTTSYGFVHDTEHALLAPLEPGRAMEVSFTGDFSRQFDQAGLFVRVSDEEWTKAGVEFADGALQLGAVVTHRFSDWSVAPVAAWSGETITVRVSRAGDALTIRARSGEEQFRLVRVAYLDPDATAVAGPMICAPTRSGLVVRFTSWTIGPADPSLH
jgi:regulation of enolase protein 1 (concanavalin A-like superfamily)